MRIVGFGQEEIKQETPSQSGSFREQTEAVRSLAAVRFDGKDRTLTYYNDRFDLKEGDRVFVSGKLEGKPGIVESVTTRFRIRLSDYERIISLAQTPVHGTYSHKGSMMLSCDPSALSPEDYRKWILPPKDNADDPEEILFGDGYEIDLKAPGDAEGFDPDVMDRALGYLREDRIGYVSVRGGTGKAYVRGSRWYEVDFTLRNGILKEAYCDCPFPGLCKHLLAVTVLLGALDHHGEIDLDRDFVMIGADQFWNMIRHNDQTVTL